MRPLNLLLRNEVRVRWRELTGETKASTLLLTGGVIFVVAHLILYSVARNLRGLLTTPLPPEAVLLAAMVVLALLPFGVATGINHSVAALFERGDLDLLNASPIGSRTVFASRVLAVAAAVFVGLGLFLLPLASIGVMIGVPQLLGAVPTLVSLSVTSACLGMLITLLLVRLLGARRARTFSQVLAALTGLVLVLASQLPNLLSRRGASLESVAPLLRPFEPGGPLAPDSLVWLPFRSMFLHPLGTITSLALAALLYWATVVVLHRSFAYGVGQEATTIGSKRRQREDQRVSLHVGSARGVLLRKEWKLIRRDPFLISQVLMQSAYLLPALFVLLFSDSDSPFRTNLYPGAATALTVLGGITASSLARIVFVGEEAPDLLRASPLPWQQVQRTKALAALLPVLVVATPLALWLLAIRPLPGLAALALMPAACLAVVQMRIWNPATASRQDLFKRRGGGDPVSTILESLVPVAVSGATYFFAVGSWWAIVPLAVTVALVAVAHARR